MDPTDTRPLRAALIPWVMVLVALFGLNALAPDHARLRKIDASDEIGMSPLSDAAHTPGRVFNPLVILAPLPSAGIVCLDPDSIFLCVETRSDFPVVRALRNSVQGRAPPASRLS